MPPTSELFRFVTLRPADRVLMHRIETRLIRDRRTSSAVRGTLFGPGEFGPKLATAETLSLAPAFLDEADPAMRALDPVVDFFRGALTPGRPVAELVDEFRDAFPAFAGLLRAAPPKELLEATNLLLGVIWDGLYVQTTLGCDRFVSTNHLVDALRVYHVLALLWLSGKHDLEAWGGGGFDEYHPLIDLEAALEDDTPTARRPAAEEDAREPRRCVRGLLPRAAVGGRDEAADDRRPDPRQAASCAGTRTASWPRSRP